MGVLSAFLRFSSRLTFQDQVSADIFRHIIMTLEAATIINIINESFEMWAPELIMFMVLRVLPAPIRLQSA